VLAWFRVALLLGSFGFLAYLSRDLSVTLGSAPRVAPLPVAAAASLLFAAVVWTAILWIRLVDHLMTGRPRPSTWHLFRAFSRSWITRYIPGAPWAYGARLLYTDGAEVPARIVAATLLNEAVLVVTSTAAVGAGFWIWSVMGVQAGLMTLAASLLVAVLLVAKLHQLARILLTRPIRALARPWGGAGERLRRIAETPGLGFADAVVFSLGYMLTGLGGGVAFALLASSLGLVQMRDLPAIIGGFNLAVFVGVVTVVAPAGVGVREATLALLLAPVITNPVAVVAAVAFRIVTLLVDVVFFVSVETATAVAGPRSRQSPKEDTPHLSERAP
jgi:hypothetical protein